MGASPSSAGEFVSENMASFNAYCTDDPTVGYYSIGATKKKQSMSKLLEPVNDIICDLHVEYQSDGIIEVSENRWGTYLVTFEDDHFELGGLRANRAPRHVANVATDNMRYF